MFQMTLKSGTVIKATATQGSKPGNWTPCGKHYRINATINGKRFSFDFWGSYNNMIKRQPCDVRSALYSWAMDVSTALGCSTVDELARKFGYESPSEAYRVFKGVKRAEEQYKRLNMSEDDLQELGDY